MPFRRGRRERSCRLLPAVASQPLLVVKTYKHPSGGTAYDIKDAASGEVLTVIENATPEQIKNTLKPDVVTEVKPEPAGKSDPILQPRAYVGDPKLQKKMGSDALPQ